jgi:hypothetical protein
MSDFSHRPHAYVAAIIQNEIKRKNTQKLESFKLPCCKEPEVILQGSRRKIPSKFEAKRNEEPKVKKDFLKENALSLLKESEIASNLAKANFEMLGGMNKISIDKLTNLSRRQVITLYTTFTSMYLFEYFKNLGQEIDCNK